MNLEKISQYFFIVASVVAILDGAFPLSESMSAIKLVVLILSGIIVGALKHTQKKEFLISGLAVVVTGYVLIELLGSYFFIEGIGLMLLNFIVFLSSALVIVGIHQVGGSLTFPELFLEDEKQKKQSIKTKKQNLIDLHHDDIKSQAFERIWGTIILVAVAFTFIILLGEMFFDTSVYASIFQIIDIIITVLFIVDLIILYSKADGFVNFLKTNMFDIIAAIPTVGVLRSLKIFRAIRVIKILNKGLKTTKLIKMYKTSKFFSEKSYFNNLEDKNKKK